MKILVVSQYFWPEFFLVNSLVSELVKNGHHVEVLTGLPNYPQGKFFDGYSFFKGPWHEKFEGADIYRVPLAPRNKGFLNLFVNYVSFVFFASIFGIFRLKNKPDIIFCYVPSPITGCLPAIILKWFYRCPLSCWVQDLWPESLAAVGVTKSPFVLKCVGILVKFIYSKCDQLLIQSEAFRESIMKLGAGPEKIHYVPNWAPDAAESNPEPEWIKNLPQGFRIIFAGNIGKAQDMPTVISAALIVKKEFPDFDIKFLIVGDGSDLKFVIEKASELELQNSIYTFGQKPNADMHHLFNKADALLVILRDDPIFSLTVPAKVQSYMRSGRPIFACLNGEGARIINQAGAGLACSAENPRAFTELIMKFYNLPANEKIKFGDSGKKYFLEHFQQQKVIGKITALLETLLLVHPK